MAQNNEFVKEGNEQLRGAPPKEENKEEKASFIKWMNQFLNTSWPEEATITLKKCYYSLSFLSVFFLFLFYLLVLVSRSPFLCEPPFLIYYFLHHISTIHPYLTDLLS